MEMEGYEKVVPNQYKIIIGDKNGGVQIYILNPAVAKELRSNLVYSYDGVTWIRASGLSVHKKRGMDKLTFANIAKLVGLSKEDIKAIKAFFRVKRHEQNN